MATYRGLVDQYGQPIEKKLLTEEIAGPSRTGVRPIWSGHPAQGLTPSRLGAILREAEYGDPVRFLELAEDMEEKDAHYQAVMGVRKRQVAQLPVTVEPASDSAADKANAELVEAFFARDEWEDEVFDALDAIGKGYSAVEIIWDTSEGQWMPERLEWRDPRWFRPSLDDGTTLERRDETGFVDLEPFKFITLRMRAKSGLLIRGGLGRVIAWGYLFKNYDLKDWAQFCETYGQPLRLGKYPPGASADDRQALLDALAAIGVDMAAAIPEGMSIEFVKDATGRQTAEIYQLWAEYLDNQTSKAVLGQTLTTQQGGHGSGGAYALGKIHDEVRADIERADAKVVAAALNRFLVRPIVDLNRGPQDAYPKVRIGREEEADPSTIGNFLAQTVPLGLRVKASEARNVIGFSEPGADDEVLTAPAGGGAAPAPGAPALARAERAGPGEIAPDYADAAEREAGPAMDALIDRLKAIVGSAATMDEARARLLAHFSEVPDDGLAEAVRRALVVVDLAGRNDVADGG